MSNPAITIAVTVASESLVVTGDTIEFRKTLAITLSGSGLAAANALVRFLYRGATVAQCAAFTASGANLIGTADLNTTALETAFAGRAATALIPLTVEVYDATTDEPVATGRVWCRNNPEGAFDDPTEPPPLSGAGVDIVLPAGAAIGGHRVVSAQPDGTVLHTDLADEDSVAAVLGMTTGAAAAGANVTVRTGGELTEPTWAWTAGAAVFCGADGVPTQTVPGEGVPHLQIGTAVTATTLAIRIGMAVFREE